MKIRTIKKLKNLASKGDIKCRIYVHVGAWGLLDIVKTVRYTKKEKKSWRVDGKEYSHEELKEDTAIIEAMRLDGLSLEK